MTEGLKNLIRSFNDDDGLPENTYNATCELIGEHLGDVAVSIFARHIDATDGKFYLPDGEAADELIEKLKDAPSTEDR